MIIAAIALIVIGLCLAAKPGVNGAYHSELDGVINLAVLAIFAGLIF